MNGRQLAHTILCDVILDGQYANLALKQRLKEVQEIDQSLVTALVYTTLQNHRYLRSLWTNFVDRLPKSKTSILLDMACAQLVLFDKLPAYAVLSETVEMAKHTDMGYASKMVNAVLRKVLAQGKVELHGVDAIDTFALNHALPTWVYSLWIKQYGEERAQSIAQALLSHAHVSARINTLKVKPEEILKDPQLHVSSLHPLSVHYDGNLVHTAWVKEGQLWLQDEASALVSSFVDAHEGMNVLDVCSAPGSKAAGLACSMNNTGKITAVELHPQRAKLIDQLMQVTGVKIVQTLTEDAQTLDNVLPEASYDRILVDVPCSGLGVLRRKADIKLRITPQQLDELERLQKSILEGVYSLLKVNGMMVYSTCTLNKKENEHQIKHFMKAHPEFELLEERTVFPDEVGSDGFYMAKLKRVA